MSRTTFRTLTLYYMNEIRFQILVCNIMPYNSVRKNFVSEKVLIKGCAEDWIGIEKVLLVFRG